MENRIELSFRNSVSRLAGNKLGIDTYEKQVKEFVDLTKVNVIIIPDAIEDIAISFVQGFTYEIFEEIRRTDFYKYFKIEGNKKVVDKFSKSVNY
ncbi:hypothetical protein [Romboutsia sp. Marseille-P6047]|uniref:hypothetical protein n=1 Tax=Romboutsia sp. Marseille-P6047 TaxID=2161817 RepID=UPI000F054ADD|nr:hypothetical protein [Romboutsia sp. Marseille-P6047]